MIPSANDAALLREHAYMDGGSLSLVLDPRTFTGEMGHKPISKFGLGYYNFQFALKDNLYVASFQDTFSNHFCRFFFVYMVIMLVMVMIGGIMLRVHRRSFFTNAAKHIRTYSGDIMA